MIGAVRTRSLAASFAVSVLAFAVPLVTLAVAAAACYVGSERARLIAVGRMTGDHLRERVDRDLAEMTAIARTLATSPAIDAGDFAAFEAQARAIVDVKELAVALADLEGHQFVHTHAEPGRPLPAMPRPAVVAAILKSREPVVSGMLVSGITGRKVVGVTAPVIRVGEVTKVVSVIVRLERFGALVAQENIAKPYSAAIVDADGRVIAQAGGLPGRASGPDVPRSAAAAGDAVAEPASGSVAADGDAIAF